MLYAFLCYHDENDVCSWTQEQDDAVMARLDVVHRKLTAQGRMGPALRLMPTTTATTLIKERDAIMDGPYAETKEALLGFYVLECDTLEQAHEIARDLTKANPGGAYEIRPVRLFLPGGMAT
jgi:hypothetical protein